MLSHLKISINRNFKRGGTTRILLPQESTSMLLASFHFVIIRRSEIETLEWKGIGDMFHLNLGCNKNLALNLSKITDKLIISNVTTQDNF